MTLADSSSLRFLVEALADINSSLALDEVLPKVARRVKSLINCQLFAIMLWNESTGRLEHSFSMRFDERVDLSDKGGFPLGYGLSGSAAALRRPVRVPQVASDPRYVRFRHADVEINSELAVPLLFEGRLIGVLDMESTAEDAFSEENEQMLMALGAHIAVALENARLYERVRAAERRYELDLLRAREIQKALLPSEPPDVPGLEVGFVYVPARELGGDFYDFLRYPDGRLAMVIGDVAGKATPAALYGSLAVGVLRGQVHKLQDAAHMVEHLNDELCSTKLDDRFVSMAYGVYDPETRCFDLANGGFPAPYLARDGKVERVLQPGLALGIEEGRRYASRRLELRSGDVLVFCTDGIMEARSVSGEAYGVPRLASCVGAGASLSAQAIADSLLVSTDTFARGNQEAADDRTVVVLRVE